MGGKIFSEIGPIVNGIVQECEVYFWAKPVWDSINKVIFTFISPSTQWAIQMLNFLVLPNTNGNKHIKILYTKCSLWPNSTNIFFFFFGETII